MDCVRSLWINECRMHIEGMMKTEQLYLKYSLWSMPLLCQAEYHSVFQELAVCTWTHTHTHCSRFFCYCYQRYSLFRLFFWELVHPDKKTQLQKPGKAKNTKTGPWLAVFTEREHPHTQWKFARTSPVWIPILVKVSFLRKYYAH